ncbi:MAG: CocE/NonD family hydrolase, partial [Eubacteriales bacterium]|nr:CocE/NonD family hydrolase [Eubacteriales bacterium]
MNEWKQLWVKPRPITDPAGNYNGFQPSVTTLKAGWRHPKGSVSLTCDVVWERDSAVTLRDGTTIYTDIYRPAGEEKVPVVISWSPYGKSNIDLPWAYDEGDLSHLQKEEGVDPALWCAHGYAVAHPDARGAYMSEGNIYHWGVNEGRDIYDYIEWLAQQPWCSGAIGMAGNSYLTIAQWFAADQKPPHLKAIAPWEGQTDAYREVILRGGIVDNAFPRQAISVMHSNNYVDDMASMAEEYPVMNSYWENKRAVLKNIEIPVYIVASYTNPIHTPGTFRAYRELASKEKWFRIHNSTEWVDFYRKENQQDLMKFFDRYLKGAENGWEETPAVRYTVLNPGGEDAVGLTGEAFPPADVQYKKLYLSCADMTLSETAGSEETTD